MEPVKGFKGILLDVLGLKPDGASLPVADSADAAVLSAGDLLPQHAAAGPDDVAEKPARAHLDEHDELFAARLLNISQRFASDASAARDAQQSLQQAHQQARTKEREVLAAADAAYTPAWRQTGIPSKPSQLQLDESLVSGCRLLDPAAIITRQYAHQQKEVLQPPAVFAYCDKAADPHFLQTTGNQKVREKISATRIAAVRTAKQRQQQEHAPCSTAALQQEQQQQQEQQFPPALQGQQPPLQQQRQRQQQISSVSRDRLKMDPNRQQHTVVQQRGSPSRARAKAVGSVPWSQLPAEEAALKVAAAAARYKAMAAIMTPEQRQLEEKIIKSMYQRLSYLRNPRYTEQPRATPPGSAGLKGTSTAHRHRHSQHSSSSSKHPRQQTAGGLVTAAAAGFSHVPQQGVLFQAYEPGGVYFHTVQLQNVGTVMKQLRLLPPQSCYFQISFPRFPLESSALAPGMCAEVDVCFMPDSLGDYEDTFTVDTPAGKFEVQLTGRRPHPELTLPPVLEVGSVLVGNTRTRTFEFVNKGGEGRFLLLTAQQWAATLQQRGHLQGSPPTTTQLHSCADGTAEAAAEHITDSGDASLCCSPVLEAKTEDVGTTFTAAMQADSAGSTWEPSSVASVSAGPFRVSPAYLDLPAGAAALIAVEFSPQQQGLQGQDLVLVCDNCTAHPLRVEGCGAEVQVELVGLDDRQWLPQDEQMPLWFGEVCPGASSTRQLRVFNATDLPFPFHWSVTSSQPQSDPSTASSTAHSTVSPFTVSPASGVLQAQAEVSFTVAFAPHFTAPHSGALKLFVQRSGDAGLLSISQWGRDGTAIIDLTSTAASGKGFMTLAHTSAGRTAAAGGSSPQHIICEEAAGEDNACAGDVSSPSEADSSAAAEEGGESGERHEASAWPGSSDWQVVTDVAVEGVGCAISLSVEPAAALRVPGTLTVGQDTSLPLQLRNDTAAPACFTITESGPAPEWTNSVNGRGPSADVVVLPNQGLVSPHSVLDLAMHFTALRAGSHQQGFVLEVLNGRRQHLQADVVVQQVKVAPSYPRLDFGVLCVGTSTICTLQLQNTAPHSSSYWCIQQHGNQACVPPTVLTCQPSHGSLAPMACCTAAITLTGTAEGTHKLLLRVSSNSDGCSSCSNSSRTSSAGAAAADKAGCSSSSCCCCNHEYVQVLVTVSSPKVVLSRYRLPIQHAFTGVPQYHRLSMTNTSALPLTFSWAVRQLPHEQYIRLHNQLQQQQQPVGPTGHVALPATSSTKQQLQADRHEPYTQQQALSSSSSSVAGSGATHSPLQSEHSAGQIALSISPSTGQLGPGQSLQLQLLLEPLAVGPVALLCCCQVAAMSRLVGFVVTADVGGLQVQYQVLQPEALLWQVQAARSKPRHSKHGSSRSSSPGGRLRSSIPSRVSSAPSCTALASQIQQQRVRYNSAAQEGAVKSPAGPRDSAAGSISSANALESSDKVATSEVLVADFGTVSLHQPAELVLQVTNLTSIPTELRAWVAQFPAHNQMSTSQTAATRYDQPVAGTVHSPASSAVPKAAAATGLCHSPVWSAGSQQHQLSSKSRTSSPCSGSPSAHTRLSSPQHKGRPGSPPEHLLSAASVAWKLTRTDPGTHSGRRVDSSSSIAAEALISTVNSIPQLAQMQASSTQSSGSGGSSVSAALKGPFRAFAGNAMMAARQAAAAAGAALGSGSSGCAVHLLPDACQLPGWGRSVLRLQAFNNLPGTYVDTLSVQVGDLPPQQIPIILRVEGSPLVLSSHRAQRAASEVLHTLLHHQHQQLLSPHMAQAAQHASVTQQIGGAHNGSCKEGDGGSGSSSGGSGGCESSSGEAAGINVSSGAAGSGVACRVDLGIVPAGLQVQRAFYLCNTGPLPMHITWEWPAQEGSSCRDDPNSTCSQDAVSTSSEMAAAGPEGAAAAAAAGLGLCDQQTALESGGDHGSLAESRPVSAAVLGQPGQEASRPTSTGSISSNPGPAGKSSTAAGPGKKAAAAAPGSKAAPAAVGTSGGSKGVAGKVGAATNERRSSGVSAAAAGSTKSAAGRAAAEQDPSTDSEEQQQEQETAPSSALEGPSFGLVPAGDVDQSIGTHNTVIPGSSSGGGVLPQGCDAFDADLPPEGPSSLLQLLQRSSTALEATAGHASTAGDACGSSAMAPAATDSSQHSSSSRDSAARTLFKVVPEACILPAGQQQQFVVSFCSWEVTSAQQQVVLSGRQSFCWAGEAVGLHLGGVVLQSGSDQYLKLHLLPQTGGSSNHGQAQQKVADTSGPIQCCITGGFHPHAAPPPRPLPALTLQLSARAAAPHLTLTDPDSFTFTYSRAHDGLSSQPGLQQTATMHNSTGCPQVFSLAVQGSFELVAAMPSVPQDPDAFKGLLGCDSWLQSHKGSETQATMMGVMQHGSRQNQELGLMLLPPGESVDVTIRFRPPPVGSIPREQNPGVTAASGRASESGLAVARLTRGGSSRVPGVLRTGSMAARAAPMTAALPSTGRNSATAAGGAGQLDCQGPEDGVGLRRSEADAAACSSSSSSSLDASTMPLIEQHLELLTVNFATSQQQCVPLAARVLQPALVAPTKLNFGEVHMAAPRTLELLLTNPTQADAAYKAVIQPMTGAQNMTASEQLLRSAAVAAYSVVPASGMLPGRGIQMPRQTRLRVTFAPQRSGPALACLQLSVQGGDEVLVMLQGVGVHAERAERRAAFDL